MDARNKVVQEKGMPMVEDAVKDIRNWTIAVVGGGHMGQGMLSGWLACREGAAAGLDAAHFVVVNPGADKRAYIRETYGVVCVTEVEELPACDLVVLTVKPQVIMGIAKRLAALPWAKDALFLTPAAGVTCATLESVLNEEAHVVRFMPNMPLAVARGVMPACTGTHADEDDVATIEALLSTLGSVYWIDESQMDAVTAVSGSGPGYMAAMIEAMAEAGAREGLDRSVAEALARDTMEGTAAYMRAMGKSATETKTAIATEGGTTHAGLTAMEDGGFSDAVKAGIAAAAARSRELGS